MKRKVNWAKVLEREALEAVEGFNHSPADLDTEKTKHRFHAFHIALAPKTLARAAKNDDESEVADAYYRGVIDSLNEAAATLTRQQRQQRKGAGEGNKRRVGHDTLVAWAHDFIRERRRLRATTRKRQNMGSDDFLKWLDEKHPNKTPGKPRAQAALDAAKKVVG